MEFLSLLKEPPILIPTMSFFLAALLLGRSWLLLLPMGWPLFFLGLNAGWWGAGVGDGWQYVLILVAVVGVAAVAAGLLLRRLLLRRSGRPLG